MAEEARTRRHTPPRPAEERAPSRWPWLLAGTAIGLAAAAALFRLA